MLSSYQLLISLIDICKRQSCNFEWYAVPYHTHLQFKMFDCVDSKSLHLLYYVFYSRISRKQWKCWRGYCRSASTTLTCVICRLINWTSEKSIDCTVQRTVRTLYSVYSVWLTCNQQGLYFDGWLFQDWVMQCSLIRRIMTGFVV